MAPKSKSKGKKGNNKGNKPSNVETDSNEVVAAEEAEAVEDDSAAPECAVEPDAAEAVVAPETVDVVLTEPANDHGEKHEESSCCHGEKKPCCEKEGQCTSTEQPCCSGEDKSCCEKEGQTEAHEHSHEHTHGHGEKHEESSCCHGEKKPCCEKEGQCTSTEQPCCSGESRACCQNEGSESTNEPLPADVLASLGISPAAEQTEQWENKAEKEQNAEKVHHANVLSVLGLTEEEAVAPVEAWEVKRVKAEEEKVKEAEETKAEINNVLLTLGLSESDAADQLSMEAESWEKKAVLEKTEEKMAEADAAATAGDVAENAPVKADAPARKKSFFEWMFGAKK